MKELRVGLIGYGFAGSTFHAPVITSVPQMKLTKVVERQNARSKERYPWVEVLHDVRDLYRDDTVDLIVVTTPSTEHYAFVEQALLAGKHVVVEKPFTVTSEEAYRLIALAGREGKVLSVFHNRRWDGDFLTIRELLRQKLLGEVVECEFHWDSYDPAVRSGRWRESEEPGSGILYDLGVHFLDQALSLFGCPHSIDADIRIQREGGLAHDYFDVTLRYPGHLKVVLKGSKLVRERGPRYVVHGTKGSFVKYGLDPQEAALKGGLSPASTPDWGAEQEQYWGRLHTAVGGLQVEGRIRTLPGSYTAYYQNIYDHITGTAELIVKPEEACTAIRLIELALQSSVERRTVEVTI
jgi:scyllo-inositol 2-dehydrogenase (NADP+)